MSAIQSTFGACGAELAFDQVISDPDAGHPDRRASALLGDQPRQAGLAHQPLHPLAPDPDPVLQAQLGVDARSAIDAAVGLVDLGDLLDQPRVDSARSDGGRVCHL